MGPSGFKLPPKGMPLKIIPKANENLEGSGQKLLKIKINRGSSQVKGSTPMQRASSKTKFGPADGGSTPTMPPKMKLKIR